jgi:2-iminoacetate synthase ThiH
MTTMLDLIRKKVENRERITREEGLYLLRDAPLLELAPLAMTWRWHHNPEPKVTSTARPASRANTPIQLSR